MRNANTNTSEHGTALPILVLVSAGPIVRHSLESRLAQRARIVPVEYRTGAYEAARELDAQVVVVDLANVGVAAAAHTVARDFEATASHLVFLGYGRDEADERSLAEELAATFNPSLEGVLDLLETPRPAQGLGTNGINLAMPPAITAQPGSPAGCGVANCGVSHRGGGADPMDLMRQLHVRLSLLKLESEEGQTLVEYGLILALIAVVCITVLTTLGTNIQGKLNTVATAL
jgi:pilus assembly protein Flp/PilA